jgi:hypothetical protein
MPFSIRDKMLTWLEMQRDSEIRQIEEAKEK